MRRKDNVVAALIVQLAPIVLDQNAHTSAFGVPVRQARPGLLVKADQVQISNQFAVIPRFDLGKPLEVGI